MRSTQHPRPASSVVERQDALEHPLRELHPELSPWDLQRLWLLVVGKLVEDEAPPLAVALHRDKQPNVRCWVVDGEVGVEVVVALEKLNITS